MRQPPHALCLAAVLLSAAQVPAEDASRLVRNENARTPAEEQKSFHLPDGFDIQLFADDAQLGGKPVNMAFDARGRLWVTSTREYPFALKKEKWSADTTRALGSKDTIRILEDTDGDGRADKVTVFADDLNIPTGIQPWKNGCIAWSIPNILFLEDTRADANSKPQVSSPKPPMKADKRTILFGPLGYERDTHGMISSMRLGLDGWIYATHGFSNNSHFQVRPEHRKPNTSKTIFDLGYETLDITSGSVFRFQPDGSRVELWTSGQVNPFGLCWDSWGNLYSADCHSSPIYQLIRGAEYPQFGSKPGPLGFGPVMCEHAHGSTGICGPIYIDGGVWGREWDDHMFVCNPVTSKVNHDRITFIGSTPKANEELDFITSDDSWFRPVDLQLGPDGALYIADFYNRIIGHYEVPLDHPGRDRDSGRIWRVVRKKEFQAPSSSENAGEKARFDSAKMNRALINRYYDKLAVRDLAGLMALLGATPEKDTHLRAATRLALRKVLSLPGAYSVLSRTVVVSSLRDEFIRIATTVPANESANWLLEQLKTAATKERDLPSPVPKKPGTEPAPLLGLDRALLSQALTHIARQLPAEREGELVDLVQKHFSDDLDTQLDLFAAVREGRGLTNDEMASQKSSSASPSSFVIRHSSLSVWAATLAERLLDELSSRQTPDWEPAAPPSTANPSPWFRMMRRCADGREHAFLDSHPPGGERLTGTLRSKVFDLPPKLSFWIAGHRGFPIARAHDKNFIRLVDADTGNEIAITYPPRNDVARLITWQTGRMPAKRAYLELTDGDSSTTYAWLAAGGFDPAVVGIPDLGSPVNDKHIRAAVELAMLTDAKSNIGPPTAFTDLIQRLNKLPHRESFSADTRVALAKLGARGRPLPREIPELARDPELTATVFRILEDDTPDKAETEKAFKVLTSRAQIALASALASSRETTPTLVRLAPPRVLADPLVSGKIRALNDAALTKHLAGLTAKLPPQNQAVNAVISARLKSYDPAKADEERGKALFIQACSVCHRISVVGNLVGPQLDGIGARGAERLLEDILDPNRAVDPAFRLHILRMKSGELKSGLLRREQDDSMILADAAAQEHTVKKIDIADDQTSEFSLMPSGMGEVLTEQQLHDLLKFLLERKS